MKRATLVVISSLLTITCGGDNSSPARTTPTAPSGPTLTTIAIRSAIQGTSPSVPPGATTQLNLIARFNDGSERDVTTEARWTSTQPQIATVDAGTVTGQVLGRATIRATYMSRDASLTIVVKPDGTFVVSGAVTEPGRIVVGGATVATLGGPSIQVTTNSAGFYELFGVPSTFTMRVSKAGYVDDTRTLTVTQDQRVDVQIRPIVGPTPVAGIYRLTLTISPSCAIVPNDQKTRTYTASIGQDEARLAIQLGDANFATNAGRVRNMFSGQVFGNTVTFDWGAGGYYVFYYGANVEEILTGGQILGIWGSMTTSASAQTIAGTLVGGFTFREGNTTRTCSAADNQVVFTRK